jgi:cobyric acid synthase
MIKLKELLNEGFTKYTIKLTKTPGWYLVHDKNGKQKFEGDRKFVTKHLKKLKTRMGSHQLKSLIQVADKYKGKGVTFDVAESTGENKMIKLKDILTEKKELGGAMINTIDRLTDSNNHNEARLQLAKSMLGKNSPLVQSYEALIVLHNQMNQMNDLMKVREKLDKDLFAGAKRVYSDYDAIEGVF